MNPRKPRPAVGSAWLPNPLGRGAQHLVRRTLREMKAGVGARAIAIVVLVEAAIEAEPPIEHEGADKRPGAIAGLPQPFGQGRRLGSQSKRAVVADPVMRRNEAGQDARVRRQRDRRVGPHVREAHAARGKGVERGREASRASVGANPIGAQRVDRDQQDVCAAKLEPRRRGSRLGREPDRAGRCQDAADDQDGARRRASHHWR